MEARNPKGIIIYIHGLGESGLCFEELITDSRLQEWSHLIPDMPGYGKSPWCADPMELEEYADYLAQWLNSRGVVKPIVLGHSMGGVVGLIFCEKYSHFVRAFIDVEGNVSLEDCSLSDRVAGYSLENWLAKGFETIRDSIYREGVNDHALRSYYVSLRLCDPRAYHLNSTELVKLSGTEKLAERRKALSMPHLYILGNPRGTGLHSRNLLNKAGVEWRAIEGAGHWPFLDQHTVFVDEILKFLNNLPSI